MFPLYSLKGANLDFRNSDKFLGKDGQIGVKEKYVSLLLRNICPDLGQRGAGGIEAVGKHRL